MKRWIVEPRDGAWVVRERGHFGDSGPGGLDTYGAARLAHVLNRQWWPGWLDSVISAGVEPGRPAMNMVLEVLEVTDAYTAGILATLIADRVESSRLEHGPLRHSIEAAIAAVVSPSDADFDDLLAIATALADH